MRESIWKFQSQINTYKIVNVSFKPKPASPCDSVQLEFA